MGTLARGSCSPIDLPPSNQRQPCATCSRTTPNCHKRVFTLESCGLVAGGDFDRKQLILRRKALDIQSSHRLILNLGLMSRKGQRKSPAQSRNKKTKRESPAAGDGFWEIKGIINEKLVKGQVLYLIDWEDGAETGEHFSPTWVRPLLTAHPLLPLPAPPVPWLTFLGTRRKRHRARRLRLDNREATSSSRNTRPIAELRARKSAGPATELESKATSRRLFLEAKTSRISVCQ